MTSGAGKKQTLAFWFFTRKEIRISQVFAKGGMCVCLEFLFHDNY